MEINNDIILVLKKNSTNNLLEIFKINIENPLKEELDNLKRDFQPYKKQGPEIYEVILRSRLLKEILNSWPYCKNLSSSYGQLEQDKKKIETSICDSHRTNQSVMNIICERANARNLTLQLYEIKKDPYISAYSHRYWGWTDIKHDFSDQFSIMHKTNFGYGRVTFFYTIVTYKNIDLVPFSNWIIYKSIERAELIRYSAKHPLSNEGWAPAMEYASRAWNTMVKNETEFIKEFIISQCEQMVIGIERFMNSNTHILIQDNDGYYGLPNTKPESIKFKGYDLELFQAEKIAGALQFINKIYELQEITDVNDYINRIEICNKKIRKNLPGVLTNLDLDVTKNQKKVDSLYEVYEQKRVLKNERNILVIQFIKKLSEEGKFDYDTFDMTFASQHSRHANAEQDYDKAWNEFCNMREQLNHAERILRELNQYKDEIDYYFENKI